MLNYKGSTYSGMSSDSHSMEAYDVGNGGYSTLVSPLEEGFLTGNLEEDGLMMDRPYLDYINEFLMDEGTEDHTVVQNDHTSYQAMVSGFYDIIGEHSAPVGVGGFYNVHGEGLPPFQSASDSADVGSTHEFCMPIHTSVNGVHSLTDEQSAPLQPPTPAENCSFHCISEKLSAPTSTTCSSDELFRLESPDIVNSFYDIISDQSPCNSDNFHALANSSGWSNEFVKLGSGNSKPPNHEYGWINHVLNSSPATPIIAALDISSVGHVSSPERKDHNTYDGHISFVKNKDLGLEADYEILYVANENNGVVEDSQHKGRASIKGLNGRAFEKPRSRRVAVNDKKKTVAEGRSSQYNSKRNGKSEVCVTLDLKELLVSCAQAIAVGDARRADDILKQLQKSGASATGSGLHRTLYYFCKALEARMHGTGSRLYSEAAYKDRPSTADLLKALKRAFSFIPYCKIAHYFANQSILKAAEGATCLHIVDYGIFYGLQWPCLINALADRKGGPPKLIITGIEFPQPGGNPAEGLEDIGFRLTEYAKTYKVPFEYHAIAASNWEDVNPISEDSRYGRRVLVINCMNRLHNVLDECANASSTSTSSQRQELLNTMCKLKPNLFVVAVLNANHNSPFFISRFRDVLNYYSVKFDMMETTWDESLERMIVERGCMYHDMLNVVACEGSDRVERPENYKQWQARIQRAGFEHIPIMPSVLFKSNSHVQDYYHKEFTVDHDSNHWMLLSWKGRAMEAISAWKPRAT